MLVALVLVVGIGGSYNKANTVHATGIEELALIPIITALLTSLGIVVTQNTFDGTSAREWLDEAETLYDEERFKLIQGGANLPPDGNHNDEDGDGDFDADDVKTFQELVQPNVKYQLVFNKNVAMCLSTFSVWAYDKLYKFQIALNQDVAVETVGNVVLNGSDGSFVLQRKTLKATSWSGYSLPIGSTYVEKWQGEFDYITYLYNNGGYDRVMAKVSNNALNSATRTSYFIKPDGTVVFSDILTYAPDSLSNQMLYLKNNLTYYTDVVTNMDKFFRTGLQFTDWLSGVGSWIGDKLSELKENIWVHPDIQDTFTNDGTFEYPIPPSNPINIPDMGLLSRLYNALKNPDIPDADKNQLLKDYINNIDNNPDQVPVPIPSATVDINPDSFPDPAPTVDPTPDTNPTNDPSSPTVDKPSSTEPTVDSGTVPKLKLRALLLYGLQKFFPFCIPWDLIHAIKILSKSGVAPRWEIPLRVSAIGLDYTFVLDLAQFEWLAVIFRTFQTIGFIITLIIVTRNLIKG